METGGGGHVISECFTISWLSLQSPPTFSYEPWSRPGGELGKALHSICRLFANGCGCCCCFLFATEISWEGPPKKVEPGMEVAQPFEGPGGVGCHPYW